MKEQPNYYSVLPANVRYDNRLKANEKLLYSEITALANINGYCYASNGYFAKLYGVSKVSISNWINNLIRCGYLYSKNEYKDGTNSIARRKIFIADSDQDLLKESLSPIKENFKGVKEKFKGGIKENFKTPIKENFKENNTRYNTTSINSHHHGVHDDVDEDDVDTIIKKWNGLGEKIPVVKAINKNTTRYQLFADRVSEYGFEKVVEAIDRIKDSQFLLGNSKKSDFVIKFDWFLDGDNFSKVLEGNYDDKTKIIKSSLRSKSKGESFTERARKNRFKRMMECDVFYGGA